jgi:hypothetical protein
VRDLGVNQPNFTGPWPLLGLLDGEVDTLTFSEQLEDRPADGTTVEEVLDSSFVADKAEPFVNQQSCDRSAWHSGPSQIEP